MSNAVTGSLTATGGGTAFAPATARRQWRVPFNLTISGTFVGTARLERSFDGGSTWFPVTSAGTAASFTAPCSEQYLEGEAGVNYRINCTAYTSGTITYRLSQ